MQAVHKKKSTDKSCRPATTTAGLKKCPTSKRRMTRDTRTTPHLPTMTAGVIRELTEETVAKQMILELQDLISLTVNRA